MAKNLGSKVKESLFSVFPITAIILIINFAVSPMPKYDLAAFIIGALLLIVGMALYSLGTDVAVEPMGSYIGSQVTKTKRVMLILAVCFIIGVIVTIAEPDLTVLASQVPNIGNWTLIITIAVGVGIFMLIAVLRTVLSVPLRYVLIFFYIALFALAAFSDAGFIPLAFDSGGVTTGPITVPFIMALGIGISSVFGGKHSQDNSFGMIGVCSIGPIIAVLILGLIYNPSSSAGAETVHNFAGLTDVLKTYLHAFPHYFKEVGIALAPICAFFYLFFIIFRKLSKVAMLRITVGIIYTYVGLSLFLTGVNIGFMPSGTYIGAMLAKTNKMLLIPIGMIVGAFIVLAEPAVHVLNKQVEEITGGVISRNTMLLVLAISMSVALALSMMRVVTGISIWYIILPGYAIALALTFFVDKIFTGIAFDSGGVASGPMTATFVLPFAMGACAELGGNILTDAFGIVAVVAMTPLVTLQVLGLIFKLKTNRAARIADAYAMSLLATEGEAIELDKIPVQKKRRRKIYGGRTDREDRD